MNSVFLIYAPKLRSNAAGVKVLHLLCHYLNCNGFESYLVLHSGWNSHIKKKNNLNIKIMTRRVFKSFKLQNRNFVVIYPESVTYNPLSAKEFATYFLNLPGSLISDNNRYLSIGIAYTELIRRELGLPTDSTLFIPSTTVDDFSQVSKQRSGSALYLGKYRDFHAMSSEISKSSIKFYRNGRNRISRSNMLRQIGEIEFITVFENTSVILESLLLGTPVQTIFNQNFKYLFSEQELGSYGCFEHIEDLAKAKKEIPLFLHRYREIENELNNSVKRIGDLLDRQVSCSISEIKISLHIIMVFRHNWIMFKKAVSNIGARRTLLIALRRFGMLK